MSAHHGADPYPHCRVRVVKAARKRALLGIAVLALGCASTPRREPGAPPTPGSVTREQPGGDAADPHEAALERQLKGGWGWGEDKDRQLRLPLVDPRHWERVRYWAVDHFVGFKYGDDFHAMNVVFLLDPPESGKITSESCLRRAQKWGHPQLQNFQVKIESRAMSEVAWHDQNVLVESLDGYVDFGLERHRFSAAYAAYPAYPDACMVFGFAVPWREHEDLARKVRDRWVKEGVRGIRPLTKTRPFRK